MLYVNIYPSGWVGMSSSNPHTLTRAHSHFNQASYPIVTVFAETYEELNLAIKECLRLLRRQWWSKLREPDWSPNA
jgi:hypothetical protein